MTRLTAAILFVAGTLVAPPVAAEVPAALAPYMTADEFRAAGLHRLTPDELRNFEALFLRGREPAAARAEPPMPAEPPAPLDDPRLFGFGNFGADTARVEARLIGQFNGWRVGTRFPLDNGQVWEATAGEPFRPVRPLDSPSVTIRRMAFGSFLLRVDGSNATVRVRRVE